MKRLRNALILLSLVILGCADKSPFQPESDLTQHVSAPTPTLSLLGHDAEVITDINFADPGFRATVFYDSITGPDGLVLLSDRKLLVVKEFGTPGPGVFHAKSGQVFSVDDAFSTIGSPFVSPDDMVRGRRG